MAWIRTVADYEATGRLKRIYDGAVRRAGKVFNILKIQSINPATLDSSIALYLDTTLAESPVPRVVREMIAVVVSRANNCHY